MTTSTSIGIVLCISGPFLALGIIFIIIAINRRRKAQASQTWPVAQAVVVSAAVHESVNQSEDGPDTYSYQPKIVYTYQVGGATYQSDRFSFGASSPNRKAAEQTVAQYTPGMPVSVHYNPEKPGEAVIQTEAGGANIFLIVGIVLTVIGVMLAIAAVVIVVFASLITQ